MDDKVLFIPRLAKEIDKVIALAEKEEEMKKYKDLVAVIRCKDCKYYNLEWLECNNDDFLDHIDGDVRIDAFKPDSFCSYGERREE